MPIAQPVSGVKLGTTAISRVGTPTASTRLGVFVPSVTTGIIVSSVLTIQDAASRPMRNFNLTALPVSNKNFTFGSGPVTQLITSVSLDHVPGI